MREATGIIPARYGATRFPGKPLAPIAGKPMIQRVYESAKRSRNLHRLLIATDDERIRAACRVFGAEVQMTSPHHRSGTERAVEVAKNLTSPIVINIQADEPLITGEAIDALIQALQEENLPVATLAARVEDSVNFADPNRVKVVMDTEGNALYFSRAPIPYRPGGHFWQHIGVYGYQRDFLLKFPNLPASRLETQEGLEQLRILENGYRIRIIPTDSPPLSVDTPQDIIQVEQYLKKGQHD